MARDLGNWTGGHCNGDRLVHAAKTSDLLIALYVGLSVPVIGTGVALDLGASAPNTVLVFAILVGLGVAVTGGALLGRRGSQVHP